MTNAPETPITFLLRADTGGTDGPQVDNPSPSDRQQGTISTPKKIYWPPLAPLYKAPDLGPDLLENSDWIFEDHGRSLLQTC
jgi:hypothetical protein